MVIRGVALINGAASSHSGVQEHIATRACRQRVTRNTRYVIQNHAILRPCFQHPSSLSHAGERYMRSTATRRPSIVCSTEEAFEAVESDKLNSIKKSDGFDVAILSNGPGEVSSWVRPVVTALKRTCEQQGITNRIRISVILAPCPHASGSELHVVQSFPQVDRCSGPEQFLGHFLMGSWDWRHKGVVLFLGGDQLNAVLLAIRLGYRCIVYAEEASRWPWLVDFSALRSPSLLPSFPRSLLLSQRGVVVGDLFLDAVQQQQQQQQAQGHQEKSKQNGFTDTTTTGRPQGQRVIALLPGSKAVKLAMGVPFLLSVAEELARRKLHPLRFVLPLAPTVDLSSLQSFADPLRNPLIQQCQLSSGQVELVTQPGDGKGLSGHIARLCTVTIGSDEDSMNGRSSNSSTITTDTSTNSDTNTNTITNINTSSSSDVRSGRSTDSDSSSSSSRTTSSSGMGVSVEVWKQHPPYDLLSQCDLAITTVGTNTAELAALFVPMVVILPFDALKLFKGSTGGLLGLLTRLPGEMGSQMTSAVNRSLLQAAGFLSWPNRWAGRQVVPELVGDITPADVAEAVHELLMQPEALQRMRDELQATVAAYSGQRREGECGSEGIRRGEGIGGSEGPVEHGEKSRVSGERSVGAADTIAWEVLRLLGISDRKT